ncbi:MAG TPA: carboxypeptidase regulatory-like domain-containing protein [Bryobacteraceae bacterium]|nr:carboxypeptidase regulatory-like domain-containing protein [Bryobacteraceae bacterium]
MPALLVAQSVTGTIAGRVLDPSGKVVPGARVSIVDTKTADTRAGNTDDAGIFVFPAVRPSTYTARIQVQGFVPIERTGIVLTANERLAIGDITLQLASVAESVVVQAQGAAVQTTSSEHAAQLNSNQIESILVRGRDVMSLLRLLPGVSYGSDPTALGEGLGSSFPNVQGGRYSWNTFNVDGLAGNDLGNPWTASSSVNLDAIAEVKVLLNNYQAEYGRNAGAFINVVTKSGSREFHGSAYGYLRNEALNANDFFNNRNRTVKPLYRHTTLGFTLGGPIYIPGKFNANKEKLFGFYSFENWQSKNPRPMQRLTMPTELERRGDFSQTLDLNGAVIPIKDPSTGLNFPGNVVPASRINRNGQLLLEVFPLPNMLNRGVTGGSYNYVFQESSRAPKRNQIYKVDYNATEKDRLTVRFSTWMADNQGYGVVGFLPSWNMVAERYLFTDTGIMATYTRILSPALVNEFTGGFRRSAEEASAIDPNEQNKIIRGKIGMTLKQLYPVNNPLDFIPAASFGGVTGAASISYDGRFPMLGTDDRVWTFGDNLTWIKGAHNFKFGALLDRGREYEGESGTFGGSFAFGRNVNNPLDSNYAYSNALLGNFASYAESMYKPGYKGVNFILETFAQDSWRVTRRFTLEYGVRLVYYTPWRAEDGASAGFALERYDPSKAPALFRPVLSGGRRMGYNPVTGAVVDPVLIGAFVPGSGTFSNGMVEGTDTTYPNGFVRQEHILPEPRIGLAYDPFGDGKTAIHAGFGLFHNTRTVGQPYVLAARGNPPRQFTPVMYYGSMDTFLNAAGYLSPTSVYSFEKAMKTPGIFNLTFGVQRDIGLGTVVKVSYVGSLGRHLLQARDLNVVPYGARFLPENADPSNPTLSLSDNYFRPYRGYGSIRYYEMAGNSSYNSLQVMVNRRYAHGFQLGMAYTWSKSMGYGSTDLDVMATYQNHRTWHYGKTNFDQTHNFVFNYIWDLPKGSKLAPNLLTRLMFDNWQIAGVTAFVSGTPSGVGFSTTDSIDITGGGDGARIIVNGRAQLPHGERQFSRWFDTTMFARTPKGSFGNAPKDVFRGPGVNNWDISLFKKFPIKGEQRYVQFRCEMYNAFNHTQFASVDATARFDTAGRQVNPRFGEVNSTRLPRVMQGSLRVTF